MSMLYCKFCRAYTPSGGDRCSVCGMNYLYREDLGLKVKQVRPYLESAVEPIRIRPVKGRTIELKDARYSEPFYAKVTDPRSYESEYLIMDRPTLCLQNTTCILEVAMVSSSGFSSRAMGPTAFRGVSTRICASGLASGWRMKPPRLSWNRRTRFAP